MDLPTVWAPALSPVVIAAIVLAALSVILMCLLYPMRGKGGGAGGAWTAGCVC